MYRTVVFATDGSEASMAALEDALAVANVHGATLHGLYVLDTSYPFSGFEGGVDVVPMLEALREEGERALSTAEERADAVGVPFVRAIRESGAVAGTIEEYVDEVDADLLVVGTHGRTGLNRWLLGSVAERVVRTSEVPVLTVRASTADGE